jgi:cellulose synthase/poly-beta-1,6-N-acetylglucosamine synthase-like glycosyltransferase
MLVGSVVTYTLLFISLYFEVFMLVAFLERAFAPKKQGHSPLPGAPLPSVAIVVPCFNEARTLGTTLESLIALEYPKELFSVVVVDDGSTDTTLAVARQFERDPRVSIFRKENGGKFTAMNFALERTSAEIIGCLDADSIVMKDALMRVVSLFSDARIAAVTPGIHVKETRTYLQHIQKVEYRLGLFSRFMLAALGSAFITPGPFSLFRTSVVRKLGGWRHGHSTEDMEMALRIQHAGFLIANVPKAVVHTSVPRGLRALVRQRVRWTYGWLRNAVDYRFMIGNRKYGTLGLIVLPSAVISIFTALYFFIRIVISLGESLLREVTRIEVTGALPHPYFDIFYINTSALWFIVWVAVALILVIISAGSFIGTGSRRLPYSTPLFILAYGFIAPLWLGSAVIRAAFKTGVRWR